jgi:hypothetical protein
MTPTRFLRSWRGGRFPGEYAPEFVPTLAELVLLCRPPLFFLLMLPGDEGLPPIELIILTTVYAKKATLPQVR